MKITTVGLDLAKNVFQVHPIDEAGDVVARKALRRRRMMPFFSKLEPCLIGSNRSQAISNKQAFFDARRRREYMRFVSINGCAIFFYGRSDRAKKAPRPLGEGKGLV